jgi:hypothetical protein
MPDDTPLPFDLPSVCRKKLTVDFNGGNQSSNGGLLLREKERALGECRRLAEAMPDRRDADRIRHAMFEMVMARVAAGTPAECVDRLDESVCRALQTMSVRAGLAALAVEIDVALRDRFVRLMKSESERWAGIVRETGLTLGD